MKVLQKGDSLTNARIQGAGSPGLVPLTVHGKLIVESSIRHLEFGIRPTGVTKIILLFVLMVQITKRVHILLSTD
jgi:hypothetical protein